MKQKIKEYSFARVIDVLPRHMSHFECGIECIVGHSYSQKYGGVDFNSYSIYELENGKIVDEISWYDAEHLIVSKNQDYDKAKEMVEDYYINEHKENN